MTDKWRKRQRERSGINENLRQICKQRKGKQKYKRKLGLRCWYRLVRKIGAYKNRWESSAEREAEDTISIIIHLSLHFSVSSLLDRQLYTVFIFHK
jgi:hypothetical protein